MTRPALRLPPARALAGAAVAVLGAVLAVGVTASPAAAMDLDSASPGPSSTVSTAPAAVNLHMDEIVFLQDVSVDVTGPDGDATTGLMLVLGRDVTQPLKSDLPKGKYTVDWSIERSLINDGASGSFTFRIGPPSTSDPTPSESAGAPPPAAKTPAERATPSAGATTTPSAAPTRLSAPVATTGKRQSGGDPITKARPTVNVPQPDVAAVETTSAEWLPPPVFWWALVVAVGIVALKLRRRRNRPAPVPDAVPAAQVRQTDLVLGAGAGLTAQDSPREALTPTMGVPRVPPATPAAGVARQTLAELFTPYTADRREHASSSRGRGTS